MRSKAEAQDEQKNVRPPLSYHYLLTNFAYKVKMHFVIAGKVNCAQYSYALMIAQKLKEQLPDFGFMKISKKSEEWDVSVFLTSGIS